jgi:hypothetical protein
MPAAPKRGPLTILNIAFDGIIFSTLIPGFMDELPKTTFKNWVNSPPAA